MSAPSTTRHRASQIRANAKTHDIDLASLPFLEEALDSIAAIPEALSKPLPSFENATRIDTHVHPVPDWFRALETNAAGRPTPSWDIISHLNFMAERRIKRSIICISTPQANAFLGDKIKTVALARLLNEFGYELCKVFPDRFSFLAVAPFPYSEEAVREVRYAIEELGAVGVGVLTNHEGLYPGDEAFDGVWQYLQGRAESERGIGGKEIVFIHPTEPVIRLDGSFKAWKPSTLRAGLGEFYFETARAISSITAARTILRYPKLYWRVSHGAGAFPDIQDRFLLGFPNDAEEARKIFAERFFYDSAGPVYPRQIKGLLAHDVPTNQFVFGTDYPYGIGFWDVDANIAGLADADFLADEEKEAIFYRNAEALWKGKIENV
ncbi:amidohydrolase 2 [Lophiostoma macrostomum CBS 122681]|uniref:Amidohydrolase 2 n=1 Tax=Lophiostoma macrostomum CBS 122681 TaxID=1314788 RepID=A0A6A6T391_9PLEO|nr:amidohydrolase 2 [Lophiostoma macrostomum CBS 122681]